MIPPRIALDTNVLISAALSDGPPSWVLDAVSEERAAMVLLDPVRVELEHVLRRKLRLAGTRVAALLSDLDDLASRRQPAGDDPPEVTGHRADDGVLACAVAAGVDILVTGDHRHLVPLREHQGVRVLTPQAFLAELAAR